MTTNKFIFLKDTAFFLISGKERNSFLQGLLTNDINKCTENIAIYSVFLSPQGKFLSDFFIVNLGDAYLFETRKQFVKNLLDKFSFYKLRADIKIIEKNEYVSLAIHEKVNIFSELKLPGYLEKNNEGLVFVDPRTVNMGLKAYIKKEMVDKFCLRYSLHEDSFNNYDKKRIENIIPDSLKDLEINKSVLLENNFDSINAINWDKGCYVGQEITARMKYRSLIKKSLIKISIVEGIVQPKDDVLIDSKKMGKISSINNKIGLAMLRIDEAKNAFSNNMVLKTNKGKIKINL